MPFQPTMIFAAGYPSASSGVLQGVQTNLPVVVTFQGGSTAPVGAVTVVNQETAVIHEPFQLSNGNKINATTITADLTFDWARYNALADGAKRALLQQFAAGARLSLDIAIQGVTGDQTLPIELRILKTTDYLIDPAGPVFAQPAHSSATANPNLVVPAGDAIGNYSYSTPTGALGAGALASNNNGRITATAATAPASVDNQQLRIQATAVPSVNGSGGAATVTAFGDLTMDLHLPTEVVVQLDRSGSMNAISTGTTTKWDAAKEAANLFSQLYGSAIPNLSGPSSTVLNAKKIKLGRFTFPGFPGSFSMTYTPVMGFDNASTMPSIPGAETAGGGTPIGQALTDSNDNFETSGTTGWRRRHIVLLTDGMHNSGSPDLTAPATGVPIPAAAGGVVIHAISYALAGETAITTLDALSGAHGGLLLGSESDEFELDPEKLRDKFIDILATIIPIDRVGSLDAPSASLPVEDGVDRAIFVAPGEGGLSVTPPGGAPIPTTDTGNGLSWVVVDAPRAGLNWTLNPPGIAIFDLALKLRCSLQANGVGQPVKVRAELDFHGRPVSGANIRVAVRRPGESAGEVITAFVRGGGLFTVLRNTSLTGVAPVSVDQAGATRGKAIPAATAAVGFDVHKNGDTQSLRRTLLDAAEKARSQTLQKASDDLTLTELEPGLYEAVLSAGFTQEDGLYTFEFHAEGNTPSGNAFRRDQNRCSTLAPIPSPANSLSALQQVAATDGGTTWTATIFPRTATDRAVGPGLGYMLGFAWVDPSVRKELGPVVTVDNLDGSYSATVTLPTGHKFPALGLYATGVRGVEQAPPAIVTDKSEDASFVSITLDRIRILDPKDHCLKGKGELAFDVVVAPDGSPSRAVRTRVPERGVLKLGADETVEPGLKIYEGYIEPGALLSVTIGGTEFDWFLFFKREEKLARYHRTLEPKPGVHKFEPGDESQDPEALSEWQVWYTVEVEA
ncbi:MAG TPA: hypothetical protein VI197_31015 [Polyangiaceae bacterium]